MVYRFGPFRYDSGQRLLFREGELVPLVPKAVDTLHVLLERHGQVVDKADLMKLVWPDTTVEEVGLARNISLLRKALDDTSDQTPLIETIPRRGYRFAAPVSDDAPPPPPQRRRLPRRYLLAACLLAVAGLVYYWFYVPSRYLPNNGGAGLAVVPFPCLCPGMDGEKFSLGLTDVLVASLSKLGGVQVVSPSTVRRYQRARVSMGLMGRLLGLDALVEGTVQKLDQRLRITVRLVDVHTGRIIWAETYDQAGDRPGDAQTAAARAAAAEIGARLNRAPTR